MKRKITKILVANRSEIACRIIRACKELGITSVAVYSEADTKALHTQLADESYFIGPAPALQSYLNMDKIIQIAIEAGCEAIHPGYGFLAENSVFNKKVRDSGLIFIGPNPESMSLLGSKVRSRVTMIEADVPVIPGMRGSSKNIDEFISYAEKMGFPVLIKSSAGGGGKGMRIVHSIDELSSAVESAIRESLSAFGSDEVYLEKYLESPRHVEFQVAADHYGNAVYLFERECSIQRRHQKIIEETPSPVMDPELRVKMGNTAVKVIKTANYDNIGTVEFLVDKDKNFYFLEVNARVQVEHPITEETTGVDLVKLQISIAEGNELPFKQDDLSQNGHSIECRIYAEDAENNFLPSSGKILYLKEPTGPGIRFDSGIYQGVEVPVFYDPILAKLIVKAENREQARKKMIEALKNCVILGVKTPIKFMIDVLEHPEFIKGNTYTDFIQKNMKTEIINEELMRIIIASTAVYEMNRKTIDIITSEAEMPSPWLTIGSWEI